MVVLYNCWLRQTDIQADRLIQRGATKARKAAAAERSCSTAWSYRPFLNEMYTVPFHWEAMSSNVLPLSEYCNAMSNFYQSDLLSLWHVVTCCLESCVNWEHASWQTFLFFHVEYEPSKGLRGGQRERGVTGLRDRPFILKGLFTMVISAWGTGFDARYQGIKARFVQQAYFQLDLTELHFFSVCDKCV